MIDPSFDPYEELIALRREVDSLKSNFHALIHRYNMINHEVHGLKKYQQEQQQDLAELRHSHLVFNKH